MRRVTVWVLALALVAGACSSDNNAPTDSGASTPPTVVETTSSTTANATVAPDLDAARVKLTSIVRGLDQPLALAVRAGDPALYVAEQAGRVVAIVNGTLQSPA